MWYPNRNRFRFKGMVDFKTAASKAVGQLFCRAMDNEGFRNIFGQATTLGLPGTSAVTAAQEENVNIARQFYCPNQPSPPGAGDNDVFDDGSQSGQCVGTKYSYTLVYSANNNQEVSSQDLFLTGPVVGPLIINDGGTTKELVIRHFGGDVDSVIRGIGSNFELSIISFTLRQPIQGPDNCGTQGMPSATTTTPITYDGIGGEETIDVDITLNPPNVRPDGGYEICATVDTPLGEINVCIDPFNNTDRVTPGPGNENATDCCPPFDDFVDEPGSDDDPEEPENDERFVGLLLTVTSGAEESKATQVFAEGVTQFVPRLLTVIFAVEQNGTRFWTEPQDVQLKRQFVQVNGPYVAYDYRIIAIPGVEFRADKAIVQM